MKKHTQRILSLLLSASVLFAGSASVSLAADAKDGTEDPSTPSASETLTSPSEKSETVYVIAGADGSVKKLIVSDRLKNPGTGKLNDVSGVKNPGSLKGEETVTRGDGNALVWDAVGEDIYYTGEVEGELPVRMKITYFLNGEEIDAESLVGKSGDVTIRFTYENRQYETVMADGKEERMLVPFAVLTGALLDNDVFSDISVTNGRCVTDGDRTVVVGVAFPGMNENLGLDEEGGTAFPSYVEIRAKAKNFRMTGTVTVATNEVFNRVDDTAFDSIDALREKLGELTDAVKQLKDGSSALYDGTQTLVTKAGELADGIYRLAAGAEKLKAGSEEVKNGAHDLAEGAGTLADGLATLKGNNGELTDGAKKVFLALLSTADKQLADAGITGIPALTMENYRTVLDGVILSLSEENVKKTATDTARESVTEKVEANRETVKAGVTAAVRTEVEAQVTAAVRSAVREGVIATKGMTVEQYEAALAAGVVTEEQNAVLESAVDTKMATAEVQETVKTQTDAKMATEELQNLIGAKTEEKIAALIEENMASEEVQGAIAAALAKAAAGRAGIAALEESLSEYETFYRGLLAYTAGVADASEGADSLKTGADRLYLGTVSLNDGAADLLAGILTVKDGMPALVSGVGDLNDGAGRLAEGIASFDEAVTAKLAAAVENELIPLFTRMRATLDASRRYTNFSGIAEGTDGSVRFLYRTGSLKKED